MSELTLVMPLLVLANWQIVETWRHGSIFMSWRAYFEARGGFWGGLALCPFCLSHWTAAVLTLCAWAALIPLDQPRLVGLLIPYWFAVTRASQLLNDYFHSITRTPRSDDIAAAEIAALSALNQTSDEPVKND